MPKRRVLRGEMVQGDKPDWAPLLKAVGEAVTGDFMWMFEVRREDGTRLQAYKHIDTRRYVHLDAGTRAYVYESPQRYRRVPLADVLTAVFVPLDGLFGVTEEQICASWEAVDRAACSVQPDPSSALP